MSVPQSGDAARPSDVWLVVPYEAVPGGERCCRTGLHACLNAGLLRTVVYSEAQPRFLTSGDGGAARQLLLGDLRRVQPGLVLWQTPKRFPLDDAFLAEMRRSCHFRLIYQEDDPWGRWVKRPTLGMRILSRHADAVVISALGVQRTIFEDIGAKRILYLRHCYDEGRFLQPPPPGVEVDRPYDAVLIANNTRRQWPLPQFPGMRERHHLANLLFQRLGRRFALYGNGWPADRGGLGPLLYDKQGEANRSAWLSVNWDHFPDYPFYFSDRLPIALASGSVHVCNHHPGYESLLADCPGLYWGRSPQELVDIVTWLLSLPRGALVERAACAQRFAAEHLSSSSVYRDLARMVLALPG